jgi:ubiquinone/menaquinone biosynthesis C-methylase UbiE
MRQSTLTTSYMSGHPEEESQRRLRQSRLYHPCTRRFLQQAGITAGMKVLVVGSGAGAVTFLAGELVGPRGMVVGVEHDLTLLETARARACAAGLTQVSFVAGDLGNVALASDFDAVIGRNILLYLIDPVVLLRACVQHLRPGGIVAFHEFDFSVIERLVTAEGAPAFSVQLVRWMSAGLRRVGAPVQLSTQLCAAFVEAGLPFPQMRLGSLVGTGPDWAGDDVLAETLCIILPGMVEYGILQVGEVDLNLWSERLRAEVSPQRLFIASGILVGAWTRVGQIVDSPLHT